MSRLQHTALDIHAATILVIDDQIANLRLILDQLAAAGFRVLVAQDGESGIERARLAQPDLILLDVVMPGMDGFETCRRLKAVESIQEIPVIFMTALTDTADKVTGFEVGGVDYVTKPFQIEEVWARVKTHLALHLLQQQLKAQKQQLEAQNMQLQQEIAERQRVEAEREQLIGQLQEALANIKTLRGLVPICAACKKIRDDSGYWNQLESYLHTHTEAEFSHGICPECVRRLYPDLADEMGCA
jgi:DNA-binding response OmpR family regulator